MNSFVVNVFFDAVCRRSTFCSLQLHVRAMISGLFETANRPDPSGKSQSPRSQSTPFGLRSKLESLKFNSPQTWRGTNTPVLL